MKNFNSVLLVCAVLMAVFAVGAVSSGCNSSKLSFNSTSLSTSFVDNAPPKEINYGVNFPIYVEIKNLGGYAIPAGAAKIYLSGIGQNLINVQTKLSNTNALAEKTNMQPGGSEILNFATNAQATQQLPKAFNFTMKITSCYDYATIVQAGVCVGKGDGICSLTGNKIENGKSTSAPVQITEMTEQVTGNKLYLAFKITNLGSGRVYLTDTDCDKLSQADINEQLKEGKVNIAVRTDSGFLCNLQAVQPPYSTGKALEGVSQVGFTVNCEKTLTDANSYLAPTEIALGYKYVDSITKVMTILP